MEIVDPAVHGMSGERLARIRPWMQRYVDSGKLPGMQVLVARGGQCVYHDYVGDRDMERGEPVTEDTIYRIYSMSKPITSVAVMMLYERAAFQLDDPIEAYLPELADLEVFVSGTAESYDTVPAERSITIRDLLTHTSGLTYDFLDENPVVTLYAKNHIRHVFGRDDMSAFLGKLGSLPLVAQPGTEWNYSVSTDVLGCLVDRVSGKSFSAYLHDELFEPLGMTDTAFYVPEGKRERFAACYHAIGGEVALHDDPAQGRFLSPPAFESGGGGLVSTVSDYRRFAQMLLNRGELDGSRILGRKTVEYMMTNHLEGDMAAMGQPSFSESNYEGIGFGLGGSVVIDAARSQTMQSEGTFAWGGMASTAFWIDPSEDMLAVLLTQWVPSSTYPIRNELRTLVNAALVD